MPMQPSPWSDTASPSVPSVRVFIGLPLVDSLSATLPAAAGGASRPADVSGPPSTTGSSARLPAAHGRPEEEDVEVAPRQAPRHARHLGAAGERLPAVRAAQAAASRLPDVQDVPGPGRRAAPRRHPLAGSA